MLTSVWLSMAICAIMTSGDMSMASMNVSLPDPMRDYVQKRIDKGHYASVSDYVRDLIRRDQADTENEQRWLSSLDAFCRELTSEIEAQGHQTPLQ
jgi:antitoxin ParD1/3/4